MLGRQSRNDIPGRMDKMNEGFFALLGSIICVIGGPFLLALSITAEPVNEWGVFTGVILITLSWGLARKSGIMEGKREGILEERKRKGGRL